MQLRVPIGGIIGFCIGAIDGGGVEHIRGGHIGGISRLLEHIAWTLPFTQTHLHAAFVVLYKAINTSKNVTARIIICLA